MILNSYSKEVFMLRLNIDKKLIQKLLDENQVVESKGREAIIIDVPDVNFYSKDYDTGNYEPVCELVSNL